MTRHVRQRDAYGCAVACVAMIAGCSYDEVAAEVGTIGRGFTRDTWGELLCQRGFAIQFIYRTDWRTNKPRDRWPLAPWADIHIASVDAGHGDGTHVVVLQRDGVVLDPMADASKRLSDYPSVAYMAGVFAVGSRP